MPGSSHLYQNYPNPFNSTTTIGYQIVQSGNVEICIYSIDGRLVEKLVDKQMPAGEYWLNWKADKCATGIYFYVLFFDGKIQDTRRLLLIR